MPSNLLAENKQAMLSVWVVPSDAWNSSHFTFRIRDEQISLAVDGLREAGIVVSDFFGNPTDNPSFHAWMSGGGSSFVIKTVTVWSWRLCWMGMGVPILAPCRCRSGAHPTHPGDGLSSIHGHALVS